MGLLTTAPCGGRVGFSESEATGPPRPWPQAITTSTKLVAGFRETVFLLCNWVLRKISQTLAPGLTPGPGPRLSLALQSMLLDLRKSCTPSLTPEPQGKPRLIKPSTAMDSIGDFRKNYLPNRTFTALKCFPVINSCFVHQEVPLTQGILRCPWVFLCP